MCDTAAFWLRRLVVGATSTCKKLDRTGVQCPGQAPLFAVELVECRQRNRLSRSNGSTDSQWTWPCFLADNAGKLRKQWATEQIWFQLQHKKCETSHQNNWNVSLKEKTLERKVNNFYPLCFFRNVHFHDWSDSLHWCDDSIWLPFPSLPSPPGATMLK